MMGFWIFMFCMNLLIPFSMIGFGKLFMKSVPDKINSVFGYRTGRSMKNEDTWIFAHRYFGNLWCRWGRITLEITVMIMFCVMGRDVDTVGTVGGVAALAQLIPLTGVVFSTERALRKTFDENGNRKV